MESGVPSVCVGCEIYFDGSFCEVRAEGFEEGYERGKGSRAEIGIRGDVCVVRHTVQYCTYCRYFVLRCG